MTARPPGNLSLKHLSPQYTALSSCHSIPFVSLRASNSSPNTEKFSITWTASPWRKQKPPQPNFDPSHAASVTSHHCALDISVAMLLPLASDSMILTEGCFLKLATPVLESRWLGMPHKFVAYHAASCSRGVRSSRSRPRERQPLNLEHTTQL